MVYFFLIFLIDDIGCLVVKSIETPKILQVFYRQQSAFVIPIVANLQ